MDSERSYLFCSHPVNIEVGADFSSSPVYIEGILSWRAKRDSTPEEAQETPKEAIQRARAWSDALFQATRFP